jgi:tetratricopeptide (TPR) repeat protein
MQSRCLLSLAVFCVLSPPNLSALQTPPASCSQYEAAVRADPNNLDAAYSLGECSVDDYEMIAQGGDSNRLAFRSSWSVALRALRHAVEIDPGYSRAYEPLFTILFAETRDGCSSVTGVCGHVSPVLRDGDSVITVPRPVRLNAPGLNPYEEVIQESQATRRANLTEARTLAERWAIVAPNDRRPHEYLGRALLRLGDPAGAAIELEYAAALGTAESRRELFWNRLEALVKSNRGTDARRALDEMASDPGRDTMRVSKYTVASLNALLGRYRPPPIDSARARQNLVRFDSVRRNRPPASLREPGFAEILAAGDTARAWRALARMDSALAPTPGTIRVPQFGPEHLQSAEYHLALGDTTGAESRLAEIERPFNEGRFQSIVFEYSYTPPLSGRAWLLSGDLASARGRPEAAARMYRRVIGLWGGGDADLKPVVDRARAGLESLSAR